MRRPCGDGTAVAEPRVMLQDEQVVTRCSSIVESVVEGILRREDDAVDDGAAQMLELVREVVGARTATLITWNRARGEISAVRSVGPDAEPVQRAIVRSAAEDGAQAWSTFDGAGLRPIETLRELLPAPVAALLGVAFPPRGETASALVLGVPLAPRHDDDDPARGVTRRWEARRDVATRCLAVLQDVARLADEIAELRAQVDARSNMVSVVAHDIRGSLSTAKLAAQLLTHDDGVDPGSRQLAARIDTNIDRTEQMVRDLLDANRVHAGRAVFVRTRACDLSAIVRDVGERLRAAHGDRFVVEAQGAIDGEWDADQLQRVVWNVAMLAAKQSASTSPVSIDVSRDERWARVEMGPIPLDGGRDREPAPRTELALSLARGGAEAHGGRLEIRADRSGSVVTLLFPLHPEEGGGSIASPPS
jgi:signal transduction histidine kinase